MHLQIFFGNKWSDHHSNSVSPVTRKAKQFWEASMLHMRSKAHRAALAILLGCAAVRLLATKGNSQIAGTGSIQGTVSDATGSVIPNASVILTDEATHVSRKTASNSAGAYLFPGIPIGRYDLSAAAPGFKTYVQRGIVLEVGSNIAVNASLTVGSTDVKVEVQAEGLALQTEDPTFKQTIDQEAVTEMPLNGRQMTALITLSGGSLLAASTPIRPSPSLLPGVAATPHSGAWTAAITRTTWPTATYPTRSPTQSASSASNRQAWVRRMAGTSAAWSTSSPARERTHPAAKPLSSFATTTSMPPISFPLARRSRLQLLARRRTRCTRISSAAHSVVLSSAIKCSLSPPTSALRPTRLRQALRPPYPRPRTWAAIDRKS